MELKLYRNCTTTSKACLQGNVMTFFIIFNLPHLFSTTDMSALGSEAPPETTAAAKSVRSLETAT